ncbi:hypothetical protein ATANTOWER_018159 [Ataeniobius toweri]|uniref:Uncharacterized protein n=1 Tax=Ataeniobius toweri TaxID=208326 RepID=A0ABU7AZM4_9TELE|nr:hypothetical protein [Ataeniobius toweri]
MFGECYIVVIPSQCLSFVFVFLFIYLVWSFVFPVSLQPSPHLFCVFPDYLVPLFIGSPCCSVFYLSPIISIVPHWFHVFYVILSCLVWCPGRCKPAVWILCGQELKPNLPSFHWLLVYSLHFGPSSNSHYDNSGV